MKGLAEGSVSGGVKTFLVCLLATVAPVSTLFADNLAAGLSTPLEAPAELAIEHPRVLTEFPLSDGRIMLEVMADLRNLGDSSWEKLRLAIPAEVAGAKLGILSSLSSYAGAVAPGASAQPIAPLQIVVDTTDLAVARAELLAGIPLRIYGEAGGAGVVGTATNLVIDTPRVVSEIPLSQGRHLIEFVADIRNVGPIAISNLTLNIDAVFGTVAYHFPTASVTRATPFLAPLDTATGLDSMFATVSSNDLAVVRIALLGSGGLTHSASEMWVYASTPKSVDRETAITWRWPAESVESNGDLLRLVFTNTTPFLLELVSGNLLVENPTVYTLPPAFDDPADPFDDGDLALLDYLPFLVSSVTIVSNEVHVVGQKKMLLEVLRSATIVGSPWEAYDHPVRDPYDPVVEATLTSEEKARREVVAKTIALENPRDGRLADLRGMMAIPWHFNETLISDQVKLSGELLFRQSGLKLEVKIEDFEVERVVAHMDVGVVFNFVVECGEREDTTDDPPETKSKTLFEIDDLPVLTFNLGGIPVSVKPVLSLQAGVEANLQTRLTLPLQSAFTAGLEMGYDRSLVNPTNDGYFYRPITEFIPVRVSDPTVFDELAAQLGFWTELEVGLEISAGSGVTLNAGPSMGLRLQTDFTLAPLENPWWQVDAGLDLIGRFEMDLGLLGIDSIQLVDTSASIHHFDLFHRDAGDPLIRGVAQDRDGLADANENQRPRIGESVRWARMVQPRANFGALRGGFAFGVPGHVGEFIAGGYNRNYGFLARFSKTGDVLWMKDSYPTAGFAQAAPQADGSIFTAGNAGSKSYFGRYESDGRSTWTTTLVSVPSFAIHHVAAGVNQRTGQPEYFAAGAVTHTTVRDSDPAVLKLGAQGQRVWSHFYALENEDDELRGIVVAADGNLLACGYTQADVPPPGKGVPDGGNGLKNIIASGLLMKLSAETGEVLWSTVIAARWGITFQRMAEGPDGTIYVGGTAGRIVTQTRPSNFFGRFTADGSLIDHVLVGDDPDWPDELQTGGNTPYDTVTGLRWTPEGLVACGQTSLGTGVSGWVMGMTDELGVRFFSAFDAPGSDPFLGLDDVGDGYAVVGSTLSQVPLPNQGGLDLPVVLKLPLEGMMRFQAGTGKRSLFLQPRVYHSSSTEEYQVLSTLWLGGQKLVFANAFGPVTLVRTSLPMTLDPEPHRVSDSTNFTLIPLEFSPGTWSLDPAYFAWAAAAGLTPTTDPAADTDGDGLSNALEAYFARDPKVAETIPLFAVERRSNGGQDNVVIEFTRSTFARAWEAPVEKSADLRTWESASSLDISSTPIDSLSERVTVSLPTNAAAARFFRVVLPAVARGRSLADDERSGL